MVSLQALWAYIPQDRRAAIAAGRDLPQQTWGTALWADLSGFTPLTEALIRKFGPRHGADELGLYLSHFYDALIAPVDDFGGSVIDFSGDAITCWFDGDNGLRAVAAAQAMQVAVQPFASLQLAKGENRISLGVKIAIASGPVRRFQLGDPSIQWVDTLAGAITDHLAGIGHMAHTGELLLDERTVSQLQPGLQIRAWRTAPNTGQRAAVLENLNIQVSPSPIHISHLPLTREQIRPWLLPSVFAQMQSGQGEFLTELCPVVALFMCFEGLNYENDDQVGAKLDVFIRHVQRILLQYDGSLLQVTIGDKGSYLYAAFGAPSTHEDDAMRAVSAALELRLLPEKLEGIRTVSIGISQGVMRIGGYGSTTRRTYGALGDDANLAARLMGLAGPGQILVSESIWESTSDDFEWKILSSLDVKGKQKAVTPAFLLGRRHQEIIDLTGMTTGSPMIGRQFELALVEEKWRLACAGQGQIVSIVGEAGIGKSRLLAEILRRSGDITCHGGECQSYGTHSAYMVWQPVWRVLFCIDITSPVSEQIQTIEDALRKINPDLILRLPLLDAVLNLPIPENSLTTAMDAKARKTSRELLLVDCLRAWAQQRPLILILEDAHWIDPLSADLLALVARAIKDLPVLILLAHRPFSESESASFSSALVSLDYATTLNIVELSEEEIGHLVRARLAYLGWGSHTSPGLIQRVSSRAQGNPFYIEELLNYLYDLGLDPRQEDVWEQLDLPVSLHSLILSRIDQLSQRQQTTIKVASILGRLFQATWLYEYYPPLGDAEQVYTDLAALSRLDLLVQEKPDSQLAYLFKHVITQEVAYENLSYATRANLHEQFARYLEGISGADVQQYVDLLAYHYERSNNLSKKREYLRKAGEAAQKVYANDAALSYLGKALLLVPETDYAERFNILLAREQIYGIVRKLEAQQQDLVALAQLAQALNDTARQAQVALRESNYFYFKGNYVDATLFVQQAVVFAQQAGDVECEIRCYIRWSDILWLQGNIAESQKFIKQALVMAEAIQHLDLIAHSLCGNGNQATDTETALDYLERALQLYRQISEHHQNEPVVLYNLAEEYFFRDMVKAQNYYEQALDRWRVMGDRRYESLVLSRLANLIVEQRGDYQKSRSYCEQALPLSLESYDRLGEMSTMISFSYIELAQNNHHVALLYAQDALNICREIDYSRYQGVSLAKLGMIMSEMGSYEQGMLYYSDGISILSTLTPSETPQVLTECGMSYYHFGDYQTADRYVKDALKIAREIKSALEETRALTLQGHILRELGNLDESADVYHLAIDSALKLGLQHFAKQAQTGLAAIAFMRGELTDAKAPLDEILHYLETHPLSTMDEIFWIYLTCYHILQATADPRADPALKAAYQLLQQIAINIDDETLRASFLHNVRSNRKIIEAWEGLAGP